MIGSFVSARDYSGWGGSTADEVVELRKALYAGDDVNAPAVTPGQGFPLRVESLEAGLKNLTWEMDEIKLFKTIGKVPASNTVEEFNRLLSYSTGGDRQFNLGWMTEGDLPEEEDSTYERITTLIKFLGVVGRVTHVAAVVKGAHGNNVAMETMNKTMALLQQLEYGLFFGNSALLPEQCDGLESLIGAANTVDLRGRVLTEEFLSDVLLRIRDNYGVGTDGYFATGPFSDLSKQLYDRQRGGFGGAAPDTLGVKVKAFQGQHGTINLHDHIFFAAGGTAVAAGVGKADKRPLPPTITAASVAAPNGSSQFVAADAGTYAWRVVACNRYGKSTPVNVDTEAVVAGDGVTFTVQDNGQGTTYYEIYRTAPGGAVATARLMTRVARTGASQVITDLNADIPGTTKGFVLMQNARSFQWAQLLPLTRIPLAAIDTSLRWAQVLYGAIKMYTPAKNVVIKNIGRASGSLT